MTHEHEHQHEIHVEEEINTKRVSPVVCGKQNVSRLKSLEIPLRGLHSPKTLICYASLTGTNTVCRGEREGRKVRAQADCARGEQFFAITRVAANGIALLSHTSRGLPAWRRWRPRRRKRRWRGAEVAAARARGGGGGGAGPRGRGSRPRRESALAAGAARRWWTAPCVTRRRLPYPPGAPGAAPSSQ